MLTSGNTADESDDDLGGEKVYPDSCEVITVPMCKDVQAGYSMTRMPNIRGQC